MSTFDRSPEDETWFVHAPLKNEKRQLVNAPPPSNIPYLNGVMDDESEINKRPTIWFKETDTDFIKLSKLGGREDLLVHKQKERLKEPVAYPRPAWWLDMLTEYQTNPNDASKEEKKPYVFEVPAWFAHNHKTPNSNYNNNIPNNNDYQQQQLQQQRAYNYYKKEAIEEPPKYGQLRNYLHPVKVKSNSYHQQQQQYERSGANNNNNYRSDGNESECNMHKIIGNYYGSERPANYKEWRANQIEHKRQQESRK